MKRNEAISKCVTEWKRYVKQIGPDNSGVFNAMHNLFNFLEREIKMTPPPPPVKIEYLGYEDGFFIIKDCRKNQTLKLTFEELKVYKQTGWEFEDE